MDEYSSRYLILAICMAAGAFTDLKSRRIPNWLSLVTAISGLGFAAFDGLGSTFPWHVASMLAALAIGMILFGLKMWGGGDGKFFAATAAWFPLAGLPQLIVAISLAGLVIALAWLLIGKFGKKHKPAQWLSLVPYGVAIAVGAIAATLYALPDNGVVYTF